MSQKANLGIDWDAEPRLGVISDRELGRIRGCHHTTVKGARQRRGLSPARSRRDIEDDKKKIRELAKRYNQQEIADIMGFHNSYISRVLSGKIGG